MGSSNDSLVWYFFYIDCALYTWKISRTSLITVIMKHIGSKCVSMRVLCSMKTNDNDNDNERIFIVKIVQCESYHYTSTWHITTNNIDKKHNCVTILTKGAEVKTYVPQVHENIWFFKTRWAGTRCRVHSDGHLVKKKALRKRWKKNR